MAYELGYTGDGFTHEADEDAARRDAELDGRDDPVCVCGTHRSEHALCGCPDGFQTADAWKAERAFIASLSDWEYERIYGDS